MTKKSNFCHTRSINTLLGKGIGKKFSRGGGRTMEKKDREIAPISLPLLKKHIRGIMYENPGEGGVAPYLLLPMPMLSGVTSERCPTPRLCARSHTSRLRRWNPISLAPEADVLPLVQSGRCCHISSPLSIKILIVSEHMKTN